MTTEVTEEVQATPENLLQEVLHYIVDRIPHSVEAEARKIKEKIEKIFEVIEEPDATIPENSDTPNLSKE